ncbi:putative P6' [Cytorhabdovirus tiliae]|uniref:P6 n=1 Tax=Cytorhabdovirus sp. 'tiliae' TaxID=3004219 RepID=A0A9J7CGW8_9RHAB|nr:putative P6' [Cytorhabdovirus tiliae]
MWTWLRDLLMEESQGELLTPISNHEWIQTLILILLFLFIKLYILYKMIIRFVKFRRNRYNYNYSKVRSALGYHHML